MLLPQPVETFCQLPSKKHEPHPPANEYQLRHRRFREVRGGCKTFKSWRHPHTQCTKHPLVCIGRCHALRMLSILIHLSPEPNQQLPPPPPLYARSLLATYLRQPGRDSKVCQNISLFSLLGRGAHTSGAAGIRGATPRVWSASATGDGALCGLR